MAQGNNKRHAIAKLKEREATLARFGHITQVASQLKIVRDEIARLSK
jgi:hypothetical protein